LTRPLGVTSIDLFIADHTSPGKMIEAGLMALELPLRKKLKTIMVAAATLGPLKIAGH
jgi:hypothetical protein